MTCAIAQLKHANVFAVDCALLQDAQISDNACGVIECSAAV